MSFSTMAPPEAPGGRLAPSSTPDTLRYLIRVESKNEKGKVFPISFHPVVDVIKLFWWGGKSGKSRFPPKLEQQKMAIVTAIKSVRV